MLEMPNGEVSSIISAEKIKVVTHEDVQRVAEAVQPKMTLIMKELISSL